MIAPADLRLLMKYYSCGAGVNWAGCIQDSAVAAAGIVLAMMFLYVFFAPAPALA
jgi:hypothetical protein